MPESSVRPRRIVVGVSGASGAALGLECLKCLRQAGAESALVVTRGGEITIEQELGMTLELNHRFIDGFHIGQFNAALCRFLEAL